MSATLRFLLFLTVLVPLGFPQTPQWIWFKKTDGADKRFFRKTFVVEGSPSEAKLVGTADDGLEVFVNGKRVLWADAWQNGFAVDVRSQLRTGTNVIAISAWNGDESPAGAVAQLSLTTAKGKDSIVTDASWKGSDREAKDWNQPGFDDGAWAAVQPLGKLGMQPWGNVFASQVAGSAKPGAVTAAPTKSAPAANELYHLPDFAVELVLTGEPAEGSWVNLCVDPKGRLILSPQYAKTNPDGGLLRVTLGKKGEVVKKDFIAKPLYDAQGMCYAHGALWVVVNRYSTTFESGLYRITDDGSDTWSKIQLVKALPGGGEHGPHAVELGPDGNIWVMAGNHTKPPEGLSANSAHKNYQEDHVLPRQPDGNGHATGIMAPGGYILKVKPDGSDFELYCGGFRNQFDFAFNVDGELFVWDADMEWDWGMPWYRPTRVNHAVSGAEFGWRYGTGKWPDDYPDSLGTVVDIGIGCPTGMVSGRGARFPADYQRCLYVLDWTYGRLMAVHLKPEGASYRATMENFIAPAGLVTAGAPKPPLNLTDVIIGADGKMYFTIGGRGTVSGLYRVSYTGRKSVTPSNEPNREGLAARELRRKLEALHGKPSTDGKAVSFLWPHLNSPDRAIRYAARIALEAQPVADWKDRALSESSTEASLAALLALARMGGNEVQNEVWMALGQLPATGFTDRQKVDALRILGVSIARHGLPSNDIVEAAAQRLSSIYPQANPRVNRELVQVLVALRAPDVVEKTLGVMAKASTQEELMHYLFHLRTAKDWTPAQRKEYLEYWLKVREGYNHDAVVMRWFDEAGRPYGDGASFNNFLKNFLKDATASLTPTEKDEVTPVLNDIAANPSGRKGKSDFPPAKARQTVQEWTVADLAGSLDAASKGRNYERGRQAFVDAQCLACHRFGREGGGVGPDLTAVSSRFARRDLLESIVEPSKVLSQQFENTTVTLKDGESITGRLVEETPETLVLLPNPLQPDAKIRVEKKKVASKSASKISPMPTNLVDGLSREEILDLLAFIESSGRRQHPSFQQ